MSEIRKLTDVEIESRLASLPGWAVVDGKLHREFHFKDFVSVLIRDFIQLRRLLPLTLVGCRRFEFG